jgi:hypothetical protein
MRRVYNVWRNLPWLFSGFLGALVLTLLFATRMVLFTVYWSDPAHRDQVVQGWMTPGYIANSWDIPRDDLQAVFSDYAAPKSRMTLERLASENGVPLPDLIAQIEAAIDAYREGQ